MARRHARRAAHQRVGAVAHAAAGFGRRGRVARVVLAHPRGGRAVVCVVRARVGGELAARGV